MTSDTPEPFLNAIVADLDSLAYVAVSLPLPAELDDELVHDLAPWLSEADQLRMAEMSSPRTTLAFVATRALLRRILGHVLRTPPRELEFVAGRRGKPSLVRPPDAHIHFNVSHCRTHALVGLSRVGDVGVDVESVVAHREAVVRRSTSDSEYAVLIDLPDAERAVAFMRLWTIKEACAKGTGHGIGVGMRAVTASLENRGRWRDFAWASLDLPAGVAGAIAIRAPADEPRLDGAHHEVTLAWLKAGRP